MSLDLTAEMRGMVTKCGVCAGYECTLTPHLKCRKSSRFIENAGYAGYESLDPDPYARPRPRARTRAPEEQGFEDIPRIPRTSRQARAITALHARGIANRYPADTPRHGGHTPHPVGAPS